MTLGWDVLVLKVIGIIVFGVTMWRLGTAGLWIGSALGAIAEAHERCQEHPYNEDEVN